MAKTKRPSKKNTSVVVPALTSSWAGGIDRTIDNLRKDLEKTFSSFPSMTMPKMPEALCDVIDEGKQFRVKINVPGIKKNEITLDVTDNSLEMTAEHKEESEEKKRNYLKKERSHVSYYRALPMSENILGRQVKAKLVDGVLEVILPKAKPTATPKKNTVPIQ